MGFNFIILFGIIVFIYNSYSLSNLPDYNTYLDSRNQFLKLSSNVSINNAFNLSFFETKLDAYLESLINIDNSLIEVPVQFDFIAMRPLIDNSKLFSIIKSMPKGGLLHSHGGSATSMDIYVNMSYEDGCLFNIGDDGYYGTLSFYPVTQDYIPISKLRYTHPNGVSAFDAELLNNLTIISYLDQKDTTGAYEWSKFQPIFAKTSYVLQYYPFVKKYFNQLFSSLLADGILNYETRYNCGTLYDLNGTIYDEFQAIKLTQQIYLDWLASDPKHANFSFGIICNVMRSADPSTIVSSLELTFKLRKIYPDFILGFDLVGFEDPGQTLFYWVPILLEAESNILNSDPNEKPMKFFFHAGESDRKTVQANLIDAVYLNSSRIGHGFGIQEFPELWPLLEKKDILIETCPISNQLLGLIVDQRNHPIGHMLRHSVNPSLKSRKLKELLDFNPNLQHLYDSSSEIIIPVSINNDDPGMWGIDAILSYDWYIAIVAWNLGIGGIKQLALNSILYSSMSIEIRSKQVESWSRDWDLWVQATLASANN